ncbi:hypothetical protein ACH79_40290 [Bradyrhizobium sp. CCBAU 051011]|uniref:DUF2513 domain-containing protein n=1 Tax=Bradyrhizobium sp. CCBAU 051011 TaxID=858422 RepID=UPI001373C60E|nr:DUF2513 domain-containing protein [Bradyrhizobium sp. CCBAU 051011]QHO77907.1 hypothetical protein ACH79_40290 [Bradyrhizobium sp. CCBAU 051011]
MKRNLDLIRRMMQALEQNSDLNGRSSHSCYASELFELPDHSDDELAYNLMQILDEGWLEGEYVEVSGNFIVKRLTADGHDFIDSTKDPDRWEKAKSMAKTASGESLRFVLEAAKGLARAELAKWMGGMLP